MGQVIYSIETDLSAGNVESNSLKFLLMIYASTERANFLFLA